MTTSSGILLGSGCGESELHEEGGEWNEVEDEADVEAAGQLVDHSGELVEAGPLSEELVRARLVSPLLSVFVELPLLTGLRVSDEPGLTFVVVVSLLFDDLPVVGILVVEVDPVSVWLRCLHDEVLELVLHHGLGVEVRHVHDDLEGDEVDDTVIGRVLVGQKGDVDALAEQGHEDLDEAQNEGNL